MGPLKAQVNVNTASEASTVPTSSTIITPALDVNSHSISNLAPVSTHGSSGLDDVTSIPADVRWSERISAKTDVPELNKVDLEEIESTNESDSDGTCLLFDIAFRSSFSTHFEVYSSCT